MNELNLSRQTKLVPYNDINNYTLKVFGVGSIGSHMVKTAAKCGFKNIEVYDNDIVEEENISAQAFDFRHIGEKKVIAMADIIKESAGIKIIPQHGLVTEDTEIEPDSNTIYCCFFDSFEGRKMIFDKLKNYPIIFVDGRIGQFNMRHYLINCGEQEEANEYEATLTTGKSSDLECGEKACAPINTQIGGMIIMNIINYITGKDYSKIFIGNGEAPATNIHKLKIRNGGK